MDPEPDPSIQSEKTIFTCEVCNKVFSDKWKLNQHSNVHSEERTMYACNTCGKSFTLKGNLMKHKRFIHAQRKPCVCEICGQGFTGQRELNAHMLSHSVETSQVCDTSDNTSEKKELEEDPYVCEKCGKGFSERKLLRAHMLTHNVVRSHLCKVCKKRFSHKESLVKHLLTHTVEKPHVCVTCGKAYSDKRDLKIHLVDHSGGTPFVCCMCNNAYADARRLKIHCVSHFIEMENNTDEEFNETENDNIPDSTVENPNEPEIDNEQKLPETKQYTCDECNKAFSTKWHLKKHFLVHSSERKKHVCQVCNATFIYIKHLKEHLRTHNLSIDKISSFVCEVCNKVFAERWKLKRHFMVHTNEKPYVCKQCNQAFKRSDQLKKHQVVHLYARGVASDPNCTAPDILPQTSPASAICFNSPKTFPMAENCSDFQSVQQTTPIISNWPDSQSLQQTVSNSEIGYNSQFEQKPAAYVSNFPSMKATENGSSSQFVQQILPISTSCSNFQNDLQTAPIEANNSNSQFLHKPVLKHPL